MNEHSLPYYFRRSLLTALGFPGYTRNSGSIFDGYSKPDPRAANTPEGGVAATEFISEFDRAILKFCDRFLATDASRSDMRKIVSKEWPQFAAELEKARNAAPPPK